MKKITTELKTVLLICLALMVCYLKFRVLTFIFIVLILLLTSILFNSFAYFIHKWWMKLALLLSKVMQPIMFSLLYFLFLTPLAVLQRLTSKNTMRLKNKSASTFNQVKKQFSPKHFENPW